VARASPAGDVAVNVEAAAVGDGGILSRYSTR
jgi:hypothetical protein